MFRTDENPMYLINNHHRTQLACVLDIEITYALLPLIVFIPFLFLSPKTKR